MIVCPCCEGDIVWLVELDGYYFKMCLECDSVWPEDIAVEINSVQNFEKHLKQRGGHADWARLVKIKMLDEK